jgi:hypothetical protein
MAAHGDSPDRHGEMDISEHVKSWESFTSFARWSILGAVVLMILLAIFRTHG